MAFSVGSGTGTGAVSSGGKTLLAVNSVVAAVTDGADIIVEATPKEITLRPGESATLEIKISRNQFTGPLDLNVISWILTQEFSKLPKGIVFDEKRSKTALGENETQGRVTLRALPDAPPLENYGDIVNSKTVPKQRR